MVAATYAAASELVPRNNLIRTRYRIYKTWQTNGLFSFGDVDEDDAVTKLLHAELDDISRRAEYQESAFWEVVKGNGGKNDISVLDPVIKAFIRSAVVEPWREMNLETSVQECGELFRRWQTTRIVGNQIILGNARRHCRQAGFEPTIELRPSVDAARLLVAQRPQCSRSFKRVNLKGCRR